jgi:hypothetical protein
MKFKTTTSFLLFLLIKLFFLKEKFGYKNRREGCRCKEKPRKSRADESPHLSMSRVRARHLPGGRQAALLKEASIFKREVLPPSAFRLPPSVHRTRVISLLLFSYLLFIIYPLGCTKSIKQQPSFTPNQAYELYLESQKEVFKGNYEKAYRDYMDAVEVEPDLANASHLSNILYTWVISQSKAEDIPLLNAQKQVMLTPKQFAPREKLLSVAVNKEKNVIRVFGIGAAMASRDYLQNRRNTSDSAQERLLAREAALTEAQAWVARLAVWMQAGVESPFDVSRKVFGVQVVEESWRMNTIYVVKLEVPFDKNMF